MIRSMFKSRVNQPSRAFVNSSDDLTNVNTAGFNSWRISLQTPILNSTKVQLLRTTIPNAAVNIPDYMLTFWYYGLNALTSTTPADACLYCVRLYPSNYVPPSAFTAYVKNRLVSDPADLCTLLNAAASTGGDSLTYNKYWNVNDVSFAYNTTTKQITVTGLSNGSGTTYAIAGWGDPLVQAAMAGTGAKGTVTVNPFNGTAVLQPFALGYTMNLRVGYAMSGVAIAGQNNSGNPRLANLTNTAFTAAVPPDAYPNLVYTGSVYLYSDIVAGSSVASGGQHDLLAVVPNNTAPLGVIQYVAATLTWLTKVPDTIYEINIRMFDDANQPFLIGDNAVVNVELGIGYD